MMMTCMLLSCTICWEGSCMLKKFLNKKPLHAVYISMWNTFAPSPPFLGLHLGPPFPTGFASISPVRRHDPNSKTRRQLWSPSLQGIGILHCWMTWGEMNQPLMDGRKSTKIEKNVYIYMNCINMCIYTVYILYIQCIIAGFCFSRNGQNTPLN